MNVAELTTAYLHWLRTARNLSEHTLRAYTGDLKKWADFVGTETEVGALERACLLSFVESQRLSGLAETTIQRRFAALRGLAVWVSDSEGGGPAWETAGPRVSRHRSLPRTAKGDDLRRLVLHMRARVVVSGDLFADVRRRPHDATTLVAASIMLAAGTRVNETSCIQRSHIDLADSSIRVQGKGSRDRIVYVTNTWLIALMSAYEAMRTEHEIEHDFLLFNRHGSQVTPATLRYRLRTASRRTELASHVTPHMLRHAAATNLLESGVDIRFVQRLLGHASITTTELYTHVHNRALRQVIEGADVLGTRFFPDN